MSRCRRPMAPAFSLEEVEQASQQHTEEPGISAARAEPMSEILPYILLGSWRDAEDEALLLESGVTHVLNVAKECPSPQEQACMDAVGTVAKRQIPLVDAHDEDILPHFEEAFSFIEEARRANGKVLVHCRRGISRSPAIVTGYLMTQTKCSYEAALAYVKERRSSVSLNLAFRTVLEDYRPKHHAKEEDNSEGYDGLCSSQDCSMTNEADSNASNRSHKGSRTHTAVPSFVDT